MVLPLKKEKYGEVLRTYPWLGNIKDVQCCIASDVVVMQW